LIEKNKNNPANQIEYPSDTLALLAFFESGENIYCAKPSMQIAVPLLSLTSLFSVVWIFHECAIDCYPFLLFGAPIVFSIL
jgi:hypothetical protein